MQWNNWQKDAPPCKVFWGTDGYIIGLRYHREMTAAWHITTVRAGTLHDYWVTDGRFHRILKETLYAYAISMLFTTDDAETLPEPSERTAVLAAIGEWEDAFVKASGSAT
jgi:hypothetical protein